MRPVQPNARPGIAVCGEAVAHMALRYLGIPYREA